MSVCVCVCVSEWSGVEFGSDRMCSRYIYFEEEEEGEEVKLLIIILIFMQIFRDDTRRRVAGVVSNCWKAWTKSFRGQS